MFVPGEKAAKQPRSYRLGLWGIDTAEWKGFFLFVLSLISHLLIIKVTECFRGTPTLCLARVHAGRSGRAAGICSRETPPSGPEILGRGCGAGALG